MTDSKGWMIDTRNVLVYRPHTSIRLWKSRTRTLTLRTSMMSVRRKGNSQTRHVDQTMSHTSKTGSSISPLCFLSYLSQSTSSFPQHKRTLHPVTSVGENGMGFNGSVVVVRLFIDTQKTSLWPSTPTSKSHEETDSSPFSVKYRLIGVDKVDMYSLSRKPWSSMEDK